MVTWIWVNIGSGNPLPEPMLTSHLCGSAEFTWQQFQMSAQPLFCIMKIMLLKFPPHLSGANAFIPKQSDGLVHYSRFNIKMSSYQYKKAHCGDKTVVRSSYLHNGISYTGKMSSLYWIRAQESCPVDFIGSGNGLVLSDNKPLPDPVLPRK